MIEILLGMIGGTFVLLTFAMMLMVLKRQKEHDDMIEEMEKTMKEVIEGDSSSGKSKKRKKL